MIAHRSLGGTHSLLQNSLAMSVIGRNRENDVIMGQFQEFDGFPRDSMRDRFSCGTVET